MHRRHRCLPELPRWQALRYRLIARRSSQVEAVFSALKCLYGKARVRCSSLVLPHAGEGRGEGA